mmetsp:Transcript_44888/g.106515  ORF Transcript_44888/g.106515 Transcript_44888/m.106515 type:complete len:483 (+) Transcript_44888:97-1545(+)
MGLLPAAEGDDGGNKLLGCLKRTALTSFRCLLGGLQLQRAPPEPSPEVLELMVSLQMTNLHLHQLHRTFMYLKQFDPITVHCGPDEVSINSISRMVRRKREWTAIILKNILELGGYFDIVPWDGFLYVLISFCTLSKLELCQVMFFVIIKEVRSWTVHTLTCAQLQEFFEMYNDCPVQSFNTGMLHFDTLPLSRYSMIDFIDLVHRYSQLIGPCVYLQRALQQVLPSHSFWEDYDRVKVQNRKITIDFFQARKTGGIFDAVVDAFAADAVTDKNILHDPAQAAANIMRDIAAKNAERHGGKGELKDIYATGDSLPLPTSEPPPRRAHTNAQEQKVPDWMQTFVKENQDPMTGHALGSAALPPDPLLAERHARAAWYAEQAKQTMKTLEHAQAVMHQTKGPRRPLEAYQARRKREELEKRAENSALKLQEMDRATQLELIRRSRLAHSKHRSLIEMIEATTQCELITRAHQLRRDRRTFGQQR